MKKTALTLLVGFLALLCWPERGWSGPDDYICDTVIFGGSTGTVEPNVLIILDTSGSMNDSVAIEVTGDEGASTTTTEQSKIEIAKTIISGIITNTQGVRFGLMGFDKTPASMSYGKDPQGGEFRTGTTGIGNGYTTRIKDMGAAFSSGVTNRAALLEVIKEIKASGWTPLAETLFEAMRYYRGENSAFGNGSYAGLSPIQYSCQKNFIILISDGMSTRDRHEVLQTICDAGDCDGDGFEPAGDLSKFYNGPDGDSNYLGSDYVDDVARYLYGNDHSSTLDETQNVVTYTIGFGLDGADSGAVKLLEETALNGGGEAFLASNYTTLAGALNSILDQIRKTDSSFVTPVVPVSPENRTYSGNRIYLGLFQTSQSASWLGNIKKFGIDHQGNLLDRNGDPATFTDGRIKPDASSYWGSGNDGGQVDKGGAGALLAARDPASRLIYSDLDPVEKNLTNSANRFNTTNLSPSGLGLTSDAERNKLVQYLHGIDAYDDDLDGSTSDQRQWVLGDILHFRPAVISYRPYNQTSEIEELDPTKNQTVIYVGSNDGMLHAFRDADGQELWSFVPSNLLPDLKYLRGGTHTTFVDSPPETFIYDANHNGVIGDDTDDRAILIFGQRRGGGLDRLDSALPRGAYYALDVTNPAEPKLLWKIDGSPSGSYPELGETWSEPNLARIKVNGQQKIVVVVGAGYDNNEDLRYGSTQGFPGSDANTDTTLRTGDAGTVTSSGAGTRHQPRGRGVYVIEVAFLNTQTGKLDFSGGGSKIWGFTYDAGATDSRQNLTFAIPGDVAVLDTNYDGFDDRLYVGDTGGRMWRLNIGASSTDNWSGYRIFEANPSDSTRSGESPATNGRKIFYRPSVTFEADHTALFFGTGDRAHPLNEGTVERFYAVKDRGQLQPVGEAHLIDVTSNLLQEENTDVAPILESLNAPDAKGWLLRLNDHSGEKILGAPVVFNKIAYFTTFTPEININDPCRSGGLGRLYAVNYQTGEATHNFDTGNDDLENAQNPRALGRNSKVLRKSDRQRELSGGIPSGVVVLLPPDGNASIIGGAGGGIFREDASPGGRIIPVYWMRN